MPQRQQMSGSEMLSENFKDHMQKIKNFQESQQKLLIGITSPKASFKSNPTVETAA
jgi:hypothetical protein